MATQESITPGTAQTATGNFFKYFQQEIIGEHIYRKTCYMGLTEPALQEQMARLGDTALIGGERKDATDHCLAGITRLSTEVKDASGTLPAYDLRTYSEAIKALQDKLAETQALHAPKQKFSFKTKKNASAISLHDAAELAAQKQKSMLNFTASSRTSSMSTTPTHIMTPPSEIITTQQLSAQAKQLLGKAVPQGATTDVSDSAQTHDTLASDTSTTTVTSRTNSHIILPSSSSRAHTPCTISTLKACCVDLSIPSTESAPFASLTITNVESSLLLCGSVAGPAHITGVQNSTIMISCRQFRMHECQNVDIYLYCTSRPIIEDCKDLRFAEMPTFYTDLLHSATPTSNQAIGTNMWEHIDDFKWLKSEQSPNWMTVPAEEQVSEEVWKAIVPGRPGMSLEEILNTASIKR